MQDHRIIITGFMSAGKTTVATALGKLLQSHVVDLDEVILAESGRTPKELIEQQGEDSFREHESRLLAQVLDSNDAGVIALGGGTWAIDKNRELIQQTNCVSVWLDAPFDLCWSRIPAGGGERPLARKESYARDLYEKRAPCYALATFRIPITSDMPPSLIANEIATLISNL